MTASEAAPAHRHPGSNGLLLALAVCYLTLWVVLALSPFDRRDWLLENILSALLVALLVATYRTFPLSNLSYVLLTIFLTIHAIGAHDTYAQVPFGFWVQETFGLSRNHFDRMAHFAFGLLLTYPVREVCSRLLRLTGYWADAVPLVTILALSGFFEIVEMWIAQLVSPDLGVAYLGTQGDVWDAQNDMTAAFTGAVVASTVTAVVTRARRGPGPRIQ